MLFLKKMNFDIDLCIFDKIDVFNLCVLLNCIINMYVLLKKICIYCFINLFIEKLFIMI